MATRHLVEITSWDQPLTLRFSPGGIPEEYTFQGGLIFLRHLEIEGYVHSPARHRRKRLRVWLSELWPTETRTEPVNDVGSVEERVAADGGGELLANLYVPQSALAPAAICLGSCWKYLHLTTARRSRTQARVIRFSFSRDMARKP